MTNTQPMTNTQTSTSMATTQAPPVPGALVLADGSVFEGEMIGAPPLRGIASGEVVFNTALSGYQEIITDPSYAGQIITFTYPHIGNYGTNRADNQSRGGFARGVIVRDMARRHSNHRAEAHLDDFLRGLNLSGIAGIDTRRLTRIIRENGAIPGAFGPTEGEGAMDLAALTAAAAAEPGTDGIDLVAAVTTKEPYRVGLEAGEGPLVVAYDFGVKTSILDQLGRFATVEVVPASTPAAEVLAREPDGVFLSNGPGDPTMATDSIEAVRALVGKVPIFGICLGHQILALAIGASIEKLPFGHHGANHPVQEIATGRVEITSQNHNFAVVPDSLGSGAVATHVNLNDGVCQGLEIPDANAFSVQHHPEASPGPHDARHLFERFARMITPGTAPRS